VNWSPAWLRSFRVHSLHTIWRPAGYASKRSCALHTGQSPDRAQRVANRADMCRLACTAISALDRTAAHIGGQDRTAPIGDLR
jgi:hypothetical protein